MSCCSRPASNHLSVFAGGQRNGSRARGKLRRRRWSAHTCSRVGCAVAMVGFSRLVTDMHKLCYGMVCKVKCWPNSRLAMRSVRLLRGDAVSNQSVSERSSVSSGMTAKIKTPGSSSSSASSSMVVKKKVDELFRRMQPNSLVQATEKLLETLRIAPKLFVNGEELQPKAPPAPSVAAAASGAGRRATSMTASWRFKPDAGRFRYGLSLQYSPSDTELTLTSLKDVNVMLTSTAMHSPRSLPVGNGNPLSSKDWRLVAETDRRVGLALYELAVGDWRASSLVALVWTQRREISRFYLQLHTMELLYSAPQRSLQVRRDDDLDRAHGLHSYTAAISLRSLDELFWEREVYQVEFPTPEKAERSVTTQLLDNVRGGTIAARDRVLNSESEPAFKLVTEAIKYAMESCFLVDFTLWDVECVPIWEFTRVLELKAALPQQNDDGVGFDLSVSSVGETTQRLQMQFQDVARGNDLIVGLTKLSPSGATQQSGKKSKMWVSHVDLTLSLEFVNSTFGTKY